MPCSRAGHTSRACGGDGVSPPPTAAGARGSGDRQASSHHATEIDAGRLATHEPDLHESSFDGERGEIAVHVAAAHDVEDQIDARAACDLADHFDKVLRSIRSRGARRAPHRHAPCHRIRRSRTRSPHATRRSGWRSSRCRSHRREKARCRLPEGALDRRRWSRP